ncbi:MAG: HAD family hydrolase [Lachnospiraceae bacterium]|nr:HAD family hydrolase [Lachnospiraceae bacterium]
MKYELVIFDMDGTILDTLDDLADSLNYALTQSGMPTRTRTEVCSFVGNGIRKLIERGVPSGSTEEQIRGVHAVFTEYYKVHCVDKTQPYSGILELIQTLRAAGVKTAVVSNKADYGVQELCKQYFDGMFDAAVGERPTVRKKPAPDSVNEVLRQLGVDRTHALYVGDSDVDIETAKQADMDCVSVLWGFRDREFLLAHGAKDMISQPQELLSRVFD